MILSYYRLAKALVASMFVAVGVTMHSEFGYLVPIPERFAIGISGEVRAICRGWPVRHRFQLTSEHGTNFIRLDRNSARNIVGIPNAFPWQLVDTHDIDEFVWNTTILLILVLSTFLCVLFPPAAPWGCRRISILHAIIVVVYIAVVLRLSLGELLTWTHFPIAFGLMCFMIEVIRTPLRVLRCFQRVVHGNSQKDVQERTMSESDLDE